jgi:hypothetical protein
LARAVIARRFQVRFQVPGAATRAA